MLANILSLNLIINGQKVSAKETREEVILGGDSIGLQVSTGVFVTGKYEVITETTKESPWENSDIEKNDIIDAINNCEVKVISDIEKIISHLSNNSKASIDLIRDGKIITTSINVIRSKDGKNSLGLYVKDSLLGVGTITFISQNGSRFGALGHSILEENSERLTGLITDSQINSIKKAIPGTPGEKRATLNDKILGEIEKNTGIGVFGSFVDREFTSEATEIKVAAANEVSLGKASIVTVLENDIKEEFDIEIIEVKKQNKSDVKGIKFVVTDKELLEKTGGIIQGMSGSPIIQNGMLIGAVSHVVVDNPKFGYGVFVEWMLELD